MPSLKPSQMNWFCFSFRVLLVSKVCFLLPLGNGSVGGNENSFAGKSQGRQHLLTPDGSGGGTRLRLTVLLLCRAEVRPQMLLSENGLSLHRGHTSPEQLSDSDSHVWLKNSLMGLLGLPLTLWQSWALLAVFLSSLSLRVWLASPSVGSPSLFWLLPYSLFLRRSLPIHLGIFLEDPD